MARKPAAPPRVVEGGPPEGAATESEASESPEQRPAPRQLDPKLAPLGKKIERVLAAYHRRPLNTAQHNPWELMHGIVAYGVYTQVHRGDPRGPKVNAISWIAANGAGAGQRLLELNDGRINARKGVGVQGHYGQLLAILAQARVPADYPLFAGGQGFRILDLVETEKRTCEPGTELTFKLISLAYYLDLDETWQSEAGEEWGIPRLVREELRQPIVGAACGGTHRLMGFSYAVRKREASGAPVDGEYRRAQRFLTDYHAYTFRLQNPDGSFSTAWFRKPEARPDLARRVQTSGHILEWLAFSLSEEEVRSPRMVKGIDYLATVLEQGQSRDWAVGPLGHALHALAIYNERVFGKRPVETQSRVAGRAERVVELRRLASAEEAHELLFGEVVPEAAIEPERLPALAYDDADCPGAHAGPVTAERPSSEVNDRR